MFGAILVQSKKKKIHHFVYYLKNTVRLQFFIFMTKRNTIFETDLGGKHVDWVQLQKRNRGKHIPNDTWIRVVDRSQKHYDI